MVPTETYTQHLASGIIPPSAVVNLGDLLLPADFDEDRFKLVDMMVRRDVLGPGVFMAEFYRNDSYQVVPSIAFFQS